MLWILATSVLVGYLASQAIAVQHAKDDRVRRFPEDIRQGLSVDNIDYAEQFMKVREEVALLREENTKLQNAASEGSTVSKQLNDSLQKAKEFASLTELEGPGVTVTLRDSKKTTEEGLPLNDLIIHDTDIIRVINELKNAGAEAVSINNRRIGPTSYVRCVGSTVDVDNVKFSAPIRIRAIGDTETLFSALNIQGGIMDEFRSLDPEMVDIEIVEKHRIPAYDGPTTFRFAKLVEKPS